MASARVSILVLILVFAITAYSQRKTLLKLCIDQNLDSLVVLYTQLGGNPHIEIEAGTDLVLYAIQHSTGPKVLVGRLLKAGVDINHRSYYGANYLMRASYNQYPESIEMLHEFGIDLAAVDDQGSNFLAYLPDQRGEAAYLRIFVAKALAQGLDPCSLSRDKKVRNFEALEARGYPELSLQLRSDCEARTLVP